MKRNSCAIAHKKNHIERAYRGDWKEKLQKSAVILFFYMEQAKLARFLLRKKVKGDERYGKHNSGITW